MATPPTTTAVGTSERQPAPPPHHHKTSEPMSHKQILQALTGLLAGLFTAILSSTIVANALPTIMSDLNGSQTDFAWVITAALLANAATTPIWGKFADLFDKKVLVQLSIVIFVAGSVLAGFAQTIPLLLTARVIQGVAMGGLTALAQAIIGTIIAPRERGRYSGYMGGVMAVATAGGPLLGGFIVDSPLGWRWTFFVCVPLAIIALVLLQLTLKLPDTRRKAKIDWLGSILLTAGVSLLLIWVSFAGKEDYYEWFSRESALMVGGSVILLALLLVVESKVSEPVIPLKIISERTTALAIIASITVGIAMFASSSYLGQYYQVARGATPTEAGLLTMPMIAGNLIGSIGAGLLVTRFGKWKRFLIAGSLFLIAGLGLAGTIDHLTELWLVGIYTFVFGLGLGLLLQNLVLAVQNTVAVKDIGTASASVAFFRSMGGAAGVAVLGAILGTQVENKTTEGLAAAGIPVSGGAAGGSLDLVDLPAPIADIVRAAYGDSTALIFLITAVIAVIGLVCVLFIRETPLRRTVDFAQASPAGPAASMSPAATGTTPSVAGASGSQVGTQSGSSAGPTSADAQPTTAGSPATTADAQSAVAPDRADAGEPRTAGGSDVVAVQPSRGRHSAGSVEIRRADVDRATRELSELSARELAGLSELDALTELSELDKDLEDRAGADRQIGRARR
ncbi:MFS transporter [Arthrobacter pityocampae]|uniref:MFS transporter n=1 Tax=Arthrobacter pityocampae TaxID=547334 RepID=UPI0037354469